MDKLIKKEKIVNDGFETTIEIFATDAGFRVAEKNAQEKTKYFIDYVNETEVQIYKITERKGHFIGEPLVLHEIKMLIEDIEMAVEEEWNKQCGEKQ